MKILNNLSKSNYSNLEKKLYNLYKSLFNLKYRLFSNNLKNTNLIKLCKRKISLIKTILTIKKNEKKIKRYSYKKKNV